MKEERIKNSNNVDAKQFQGMDQNNNGWIISESTRHRKLEHNDSQHPLKIRHKNKEKHYYYYYKLRDIGNIVWFVY